MKAIVQERFGGPDVLELMDVDVPHVGPDDVLVRVQASSLNPYDWHMLRGDPRLARFIGGTGLTRPKSPVAGIDAAGRVEAVGANVTAVRQGDEVYGFCRGAFAEYAVVDAGMVAPKPEGLTFEEAAAVPMAGLTALHAIRHAGQVREGQRVLVNGAAGGVGSFAVQIAVAAGAQVTGVCSHRNVELVRSLGAHHVVDYGAEDFTDRAAHHDVVLDTVGNRPLSRLRHTCTPTGTIVLCYGGDPRPRHRGDGPAHRGVPGRSVRPATDPAAPHRPHPGGPARADRARRRREAHAAARPDVLAGRRRRRPALRRAGARAGEGRRQRGVRFRLPSPTPISPAMFPSGQAPCLPSPSKRTH